MDRDVLTFVAAGPAPTRPTVVYVTNRPPAAASGGQLRERELLGRLVDHVSVHLVVVSTHFDEDRSNAQAALDRCASVTLVRARPDPNGVGDRAHLAPAAAAEVTRLLEQLHPEVVHVEGYFLLDHVPASVDGRLVVGTENVEHELVAAVAHRPGEVEAVRDLERSGLRRAAACVAVSPEDQATLSALRDGPVRLVANGNDHVVGGQYGDPAARSGICYFANYGWHPSADAAEHLLADLWPAIARRCPDAILTLAGTAMSADLADRARRAPGVRAIGRFSTPAELLGDQRAFLCPIRYGGGVKMKVVEALRYGMPTACTTISLQGLPTDVGRAVLCADQDEDLVEAAVRLLTDDRLAAALSRAAVDATRDLTTWEDAAEQLRLIWEAVAVTSGRTAACGSWA